MLQFIRKKIKYIIYLIISILYILILSKSTSPLYDGSYTIDSSVFRVIGKGITQGYIPYVDLFDHKGPILFFIQALGIIINAKFGIVLLQIINMYITIIFLDKLINLFENNVKKKYVSLTLILIFYAIIFGEGNFSEEWSLSLITISLYNICKGLINEKFTKIDYFIHGMVFATISLIRLNNAATIVGFAIFYFFFLIVKKKYKELINFIMWFILGILVVYIPIIIVFVKWDALNEMIYATFTFNFLYSSNEMTVSIATVFIKILGLIPLIFASFTNKDSKFKNSLKRCFYVIIVSNIICVSIGYAYLHYYIIIIPLIAVLITQINFNTRLNGTKIIDAVNKYLIIIGIIMYAYFINIENNWDKQNYIRQKIVKNEIEDLEKYIEDKNSVLCYDVPARIYLLLDVTPCYKYFTNQSWHILNDSNLKTDLSKYIEGNNVKYIITYNDNNYQYNLNNYKLLYKNDSFILYKLNEV